MGKIGDLFKNTLKTSFSQPGMGTGAETLKSYSKVAGKLKEEDVTEKWSEKYKKSIDCSHPKGFSQRAHCQGRKKKEKTETKEVKDLNLSKDNEDMVNGIVDLINQVKDVKNKKQIAQNMIKQFKRENIKVDMNEFMKMCNLDGDKKVENKEATGSGSSGGYEAPLFGGESNFAKKSDAETPKLTKEGEVEKVEAKEATTSGSVGGYESPSMWAKSTKKKDWGPSRKTQIPGGGFVKIKKRCTKFPYCNQGDINNIKISKNESVQDAIKNVSKNMKISEDRIKKILEQEILKLNKRTK